VALGSGLAKATGARSIAIANNALASGADSVAIGRSAESSASAAFTFGYHCVASAANTIATGLQSVAAIIGKSAYASGSFAGTNNGDAQGGQFVLRSDTTDATAEAMTTNNSTAAATNQIVAASDTCITFHGTVVAMQNGAQAHAGWEIKGMLVNDGGTTSLALGNVSDMAATNASSWAVALSADNTNNALKIQVTGEASHNIRWVANVHTSEVTYA
jgi:autotransporter adhesin